MRYILQINISVYEIDHEKSMKLRPCKFGPELCYISAAMLTLVITTPHMVLEICLALNQIYAG